ncbi:putative acyl-CoA dehydrogenase IBR3 [Drosera capensis]
MQTDSAARARGLLFDESQRLSTSGHDLLLGAGLSNLEYGYLCEVMGRSVWAPLVFNCGAPDTGNMEGTLCVGISCAVAIVETESGSHNMGIRSVEEWEKGGQFLEAFNTVASDASWLIMNFRAFAWKEIHMSSMAPNSGPVELWILDANFSLSWFGKTDFNAPKDKQQSMILVDIKTPGVHIKRPLMVFGFDNAPHGHAEVVFDNLWVPAKNLLLGEGRGFEIAQSRLGPGRLHHCMRLMGAAERGMQMMAERAFREECSCRVDLERTRLLVLEAADQLDRLGNKKARGIIAMAKVAAPAMALHVLDMAMQVHGAAGLSSHTVLAHLWATSRMLRVADGPDEVQVGTMAKLELRKALL